MIRLSVRDLQPKEVEELQIVPGQRFSLADLDNELYCCKKAIIDDNGVVVAVGIARLTSEVILVMNEDAPRTVKARSVEELHDTLKAELSALGMDETHAFIEDKDPELRSLLKRKFGFTECSAHPIYRKF
jgi:hypothetical protein